MKIENGRAVVFLFAASFIFSAAVSRPQPAQAFEERIAAAICRQTTEVGDTTTSYGGLTSNRADPERSAEYWCPLPSHSDLNHLSIRRIHLHGADNHLTREVSAQACITFFDVPGGSCGALDASNFTGNYQIELTGTSSGGELGVLANGANWGDFPYVWVEVPPRPSGGMTSTLRGIYVTTVF